MQPDRISPAEVMRRINRHERLVFVDARTEEEWCASDELIGSATRLPPGEVEKHAMRLPKNSLVVYGTTANEATTLEVARELMSRGFLGVRVLEGGLEAWKESKGFVARKPTEEPKRHVERQRIEGSVSQSRHVETSGNVPREGVGSGNVVETPLSTPPSTHRKQPDQPAGLQEKQHVDVEPRERPSRHSHP